MKKSTTTIFLLAICVLVFGQSSQIETKLKGIQVQSIKGGKLVDYDLIKQIKNKVVILEFWETWCGPCIQSMPHLKDLKDKFPNDLLVICISSDDIKKTSTFITEHSYPFDYLFDTKKQLSAVFPHSSIPHTVIISKKGEIEAETYPGYLTEEVVKNLISGNSIDVPLKTNFDPDKLESNKTEQSSLLLFDLKNSELDDKNYCRYSTKTNKKRIVTGYQANAFKDTIETIRQASFAGKNILELYSYAYKDFNEYRFKFSKELNYIKSSSPNNKYKLNFTVSDLFGDFNAIMIRQLNAAFGLTTEKVLIDTTVLILKKIEPNGRSITIESNPNRDKSEESKMLIQSIDAKCTFFSLSDIAHLIENKTHIPVETVETDSKKYNLNILIEANLKTTLDEWLRLFEKEGIYLVKEKKKAEFIRILKN